MRDLIWTLIVIWLVYKVIDLFKASTAKKSYVNSEGPSQKQPHSAPHASTSKKDIKSAIQKHLNNDGEYVDFEEVK